MSSSSRYHFVGSVVLALVLMSSGQVTADSEGTVDGDLVSAEPTAQASSAGTSEASQARQAGETSGSEAPEQQNDDHGAADEAEPIRFVDEVVVTAGKRETFLLSTPIALTAPRQEQLDLLNVRDVKSINQLVPNLHIVDSSIDGGGSVEINMRGISNSDFNETGDPNVSLSIDGVYTARPQAALQLLHDIERVEVSRGPQGTLAGRNASVGAINIIPRAPNASFIDAMAEVETSSESGRAFRGMLNYPLIEDELAIRVNIAGQIRESPYELVRDDVNTVTGAPSKGVYEANYGSVTDLDRGAGSQDDLAFRGSLLYTPKAVKGLSAQLTYEYFNDRSPGSPGVLDCDRIQCATTAGLEPEQIRAIDDDPFTSIVSTPFRQDMSIDSYRLKIRYDISDVVAVKLMRAESTFHTDLIQDLDAGLANEIVFTNDWTNETESTEINLTSLHEGPFQWTAGYFDLYETNDRLLGIDVPPFGWLAFWQPDTFSESEAFYADGTYDLGRFEVFGGLRLTKDFKRNRGGGQYQCWGGYDSCDAMGTIPFSVLLGDRDGDPSTGINGQDNRILDFSNDGREFSYDDLRAGLGYTTEAGTYYYLSVATGHKAGLFDTPIVTQRTGETTIYPLEPEKNTTYEIGVKGKLLNGRLNYALAYFNSDFEGKQEASIIPLGDRHCDDPFQDGLQVWVDDNGDPIAPCADPGSGFIDLDDSIFPDQVEFTTINIDGLDVQGVELEYDWALTTDDFLSGFLSWIDAEYKDFLAADVIQCGVRYPELGGLCPIENLAGNVPKNTPDLSANMTYYHIFRLSSGGLIVPLVNAYYRSKQHLTEFNTEGRSAAYYGLEGNENELYSDVQDASLKVNINLRYTTKSGKIDYELFGSNILNEDIKAFERTDTGSQPIYILEDPRQVGLRLRYRFW